jgi:hypothetical protein
MKGLDFEQSLRSYYGLDTVAWLQMNAYWGPRMQDPSILPTYWEVRRATEARLGAGAPEEPALVSPDAPGPQGLAWARLEQAFGGVDVPVGGDFQVIQVRDDFTQVQSERTGIVLMLRHQLGVSATGRESYTDSLISVNQRDAPRFRLVAKSYGKVGILLAARVDGEFDNGTHFVTRDYVLFPPQMAILLMARGPVQVAGAVHAIADRVAASIVR